MNSLSVLTVVGVLSVPGLTWLVVFDCHIQKFVEEVVGMVSAEVEVLESPNHPVVVGSDDDGDVVMDFF